MPEIDNPNMSYKENASYTALTKENQNLIDETYKAEYFAHHLIYQKDIQALTEPTHLTTPFNSTYTVYPLKDTISQAGLVACIFVSNDAKESSGSREVRLVFRGTGCRSSLLRDLDAKGAGASTLATDAQPILQQLNAIISDNKKNESIHLKISGHSLGGADAYGFSGFLFDAMAINQINSNPAIKNALEEQKKSIHQTDMKLEALNKIKRCDIETFNAARISRAGANSINNAALIASHQCTISARVLIAEGDVIQRTGEAVPFIAVANDEEKSIRSHIIKVRHKAVKPFKESILNAKNIPTNTLLAHTAKYFFNTFNRESSPLEFFSLLNHHTDSERMDATANAFGITDNFLIRSALTLLDQCWKNPETTFTFQEVPSDIDEASEGYIQIDRCEKNLKTSQLDDTDIRAILQKLRKRVIDIPEEEETHIQMIEEEKPIGLSDSSRAHDTTLNNNLSALNIPEKIIVQPDEKHSEKPEIIAQSTSNVSENRDKTSVKPQQWYSKLTKRQKIALAVGIGFALSILGVTTGGLIYAAAAAVIIGASFISSLTALISFSSITAGGVIAVSTTAVTTPIIADFTYKKLMSFFADNQQSEPNPIHQTAPLFPNNIRDQQTFHQTASDSNKPFNISP